jgi:hypothetical protein
MCFYAQFLIKVYAFKGFILFFTPTVATLLTYSNFAKIHILKKKKLRLAEKG